MDSRSISILSARRILNIDDLHEVIVLLERHNYDTTSYYRLGLALQLSDNKLKIIEQQYVGQAYRCFTECLASWLRKADHKVVENPTIDILITALREIKENSVADHINKERQNRNMETGTKTYDCTSHSINEQYPANKQLHSPNRPCDMARLLLAEGIINEEAVTDVLNLDNKPERCQFLLMKVKLAFKKDYKKLLMFARSCAVTGNMVQDCSTAFESNVITYSNEGEFLIPCRLKAEIMLIEFKCAISKVNIEEEFFSEVLKGRFKDMLSCHVKISENIIEFYFAPDQATLLLAVIAQSSPFLYKQNIVKAIKVGHYPVYDETHWNEAHQNKERIKALKEEQDKLKAKHDNLKQNYETLCTEAHQKEERINVLEEEHDKLKEEQDSLKQDYETLCTEACQKQERIKTLEEEHDNLKQDYETLCTEAHQKEERIKALEEDHDNLKQDYETLCTEAHQKEERIKALKDEHDNLKQDYETICTEAHQKEERIKALKDEHDNLKQDYETICTEACQKQERIKALEEEHDKLKEEQDSLKQDYETICTEARQKEERIKALEEEQNKLKKDYEIEAHQKGEIIKVLEEEQNKLKKNLSHYEDLFNEAFEFLLQITSAIKNNTLEHEDLMELYEKKNLELNNLEAEILNYETAYQELLNAFDNRNLELQCLKQEFKEHIEGLEKDNEDLKEKLILLEIDLQKKEGQIQKFESIDSIQKELLQTKERMLRSTRHEIEDLKLRLSRAKEEKQEEIISLEGKNKTLEKNLQRKSVLIEMVFQQLTEAKSEIRTLQEKLRMETERNIRFDTFREETISLEQEYDPHTENISVSDSEITLTAPCLKTCKEIQIPETAQLISLHDAFADSASAILLRLQMTSIAYLCINRTRLSHDSVHSIVDVLKKLKALRLSNVYLPPTSLSYILNALLTNESVQEFTVQFDNQMMLPLSSTSAASYAQAISDIIRSNSTLQYISILGLRLGEAGVVKILLALAKDNNTLRLLTLNQSHQDTAYRFAEANGPIKDRLSFS